METVNLLAASVKRSSTNQGSNPALVRKGSLTVEIRAEHRSKDASAEMPIKRIVLFQFLILVIIWLFIGLCEDA